MFHQSVIAPSGTLLHLSEISFGHRPQPHRSSDPVLDAIEHVIVTGVDIPYAPIARARDVPLTPDGVECRHREVILREPPSHLSFIGVPFGMSIKPRSDSEPLG